MEIGDPVNFDNLRKSKRIAVQSDLIMTLANGKACKGMTINVSEGGAMISVDGIDASIGDQVFIELIGQFRYELGFLIAKIVHHRQDRVRGGEHRLSGLQFTHLTKLQKQTIRGMLEKVGGFL